MHNKQAQNRRSKSCYQSAYSSNNTQTVARKTYIKVLSNTSSAKNFSSSLSDLYEDNNEPIKHQQYNRLIERQTSNHDKDIISNGSSYHMRSASMPNKTLYLHKTVEIPCDLSYLTPTSISINFLSCTLDQCMKKLDVSQQKKRNNNTNKNFQFYISGNRGSNNQHFDGKSSVNESTLDSLQINSLSFESKNHKNRAFGQIKHQKNYKKQFCFSYQKENSQIWQKQKYDPKVVRQYKEIKLKVKHILLPKRAPIPQ